MTIASVRRAVGPVDDAGPGRRVDPHERLLGGVAEEAGLGVLVDDFDRRGGVENMTRPSLLKILTLRIPCLAAIVSITW